MKKIFKIFAAVSVLAGLVSCVKYADYKTEPFASLDVASAKVTEPAIDASAVTYKLPVHVYNATSDCSVSYEIKDVTAKQGVDYTIVNGTGVLNFPKGVETQEIEFSVSGQPGTFTGDVNFQVILKEATNNVALGAISTAKITIADKDHPLVSLFGNYQMQSVDVSSSGSYIIAKWETEIKEYPGDVTRVILTNPTYLQTAYAFPGDLSIYGVVNEDMTKITFPLPQDTKVPYTDFFNPSPELGGAGEVFTFVGWDGPNLSGKYATLEDYNVEFNLQEDGTWVTANAYVLNTRTYVNGSQGDWLYYYMNCLAGFNPASYPTSLTKLD